MPPASADACQRIDRPLKPRRQRGFRRDRETVAASAGAAAGTTRALERLEARFIYTEEAKGLQTS